MTSIKDYELMAAKQFINAFFSDLASFKIEGGKEEQFELFLKWAEVQKLERINATLDEILSSIKKG